MKKFLYIVFIVIILSSCAFLLWSNLKSKPAEVIELRYSVTEATNDTKPLKNPILFTWKHNDKNAPDTAAIDILHKYLLVYAKDYPYTDENGNTKYFEIYKDSVQAFSYDLNEDGNKEVIGFLDSSFSCGRQTCDLFILQKQNEEYIAIFNNPIPTGMYKFSISENKTNGYHDINVYIPFYPKNFEVIDILQFTQEEKADD